LQGWLAALFFWLALCMPAAALAQGADLVELEVKRDEAGLLLDFNVRLQLPRAVDEALQRGVPVYFQAQATTYRARWYWRDERVARATRSWRLSYQPLTSSWRVTQGGLHQPYETLQDALLSISRNSRWKIADSTEVEPGSGYYVEFGYKLDTTQLPRPMQIGIGGDWNLQAERTLRLE
jgi:hypothetical protein